MEEMKAVLLRNLHLFSSSNNTTAAANIVASLPLTLNPALGELTLSGRESGELTFTSCRGELFSGPAKQDSARRDVHSQACTDK